MSQQLCQLERHKQEGGGVFFTFFFGQLSVTKKERLIERERDIVKGEFYNQAFIIIIVQRGQQQYKSQFKLKTDN